MSALLPERVVMAQPSLVRALGLTQAIVLQQLQWHVTEGATEEHDGQVWTPVTQHELAAEIGLSRDAIYRATVSLRDAWLVVTCQPEGIESRRIWYRIAYDHPRLTECAPARKVRRASAQASGAESRNLPLLEDQERNETRRKRRPPRDFEPTEDHRNYARAHGLAVEDERDGWLDWCEAHGRTYASVNAGFSTWLRQAVKFGRGTVLTGERGKYLYSVPKDTMP